jgi:alpha-glucosidase
VVGVVDADDSARTVDANWWRQAVVYQVYPRSFADANSDGVGDLKGVTSRVPYLASLGVDALWLSPFYPSALADGGYDVDDYRDVDARLGTLEDLDELLGVLSAAGLRLIVDIVPNHTSDRHAWFREALAAPRGSRARDRYIFRDGTGPNGAQPPSDWQSGFGGSMWTQVGDGQWYLHIHAREQPDLNWDHRDVRDDFLRTLRFWADRGVDGFRVDVAHLLAKHLVDPLPAAASLGTLAHGAHPFEDRDEVHEIYAEWRHVFNEYAPPRMAVAEAWVHASRRPRYASATGLGQAFNFDLLKANWDRDEFAEIITHNLRQAEHSGASCTWVLSNHDVVRHATRYGLPQGTAGSSQDGRAWLLSRGQEPALDAKLGVRRARAATLLMLALPGSAYLYQGEELGLHEVADLPCDVRQDPTFRRTGGREPGRDGCRVPLPWTVDGASFGFGADGAHLPQPPWFGSHSVQAQANDPGSTLAFYRDALRVRAQLHAVERLDWVETRNPEVLQFIRPGSWLSITNFGRAPIPLTAGEVAIVSAPLIGDQLPQDTTAWIVQARARPATG